MPIVGLLRKVRVVRFRGAPQAVQPLHFQTELLESLPDSVLVR
jgi:hypothetical protein